MNKKMIMIGHGHLDPVWLWDWQEGMQEVKATFQSALDRMEEYEDFVFTCSSAAFYEFVEKNAPEVFEKIRERVREGRWSVVGGWWIEPDCNIPCGESFARQALIAQSYYFEKFGTYAQTGFCPDSFGHAGTLPMLLQKGRMKNYVFMRPMPGEKPLPGETFNWYAADGSKVCAFRIPYEYLSWEEELRNHIDRCFQGIKEPLNKNMCFYGVGNHGGGPTKANLECIGKVQEEGLNIFCGSVEEYFDREDKDIRYPVVEEELQYHSPGCYSACSMVKRYNRKSENSLIQSEIFCSFSDIEKKYPYPDNFNEAWKKVLFNQFHDILAGTCIASAYEQVRDRYGYALTISAENRNHAVQSIAWNIHIPQESNMVPIVLFHSHSVEATVPIEVEFQGNDEVIKLSDFNGESVPFAMIPEESLAGRRTRIVFQAKVPPMGYCVYRAYRNCKSRKWVEAEELQEKIIIENEYLRLIFEKEGCGGIDVLYDKEYDIFASRKGIGVPKIISDEESDTWAHNIYQFRQVCGEFKQAKAELLEKNTVRQAVRITSVYETSKIVQVFYLYHGSREIRVSVSLNWQEKRKIAKLYFFPDTIFNRSIYEIPYGKQERPINGGEVCGQRWLSYAGVVKESGIPYGLGLVNDGQYSFSAEYDLFSMTLVRSSVYAHHEPEALPVEERRHYMDLGEHEFEYVLMPYKGEFENSSIICCANELNAPVEVLVETYHKGELPMQKSYIEVRDNRISITALKKAECKNGYIVRMQELFGNMVKTEMCFGDKKQIFPLEFRQNEVKSIWIYTENDDGQWKAKETDFLETEEK